LTNHAVIAAKNRFKSQMVEDSAFFAGSGGGKEL